MNILNAFKSVIIQQDIKYGSIKAFNVGVLLRVTQLNKNDLNAFTYSHLILAILNLSNFFAVLCNPIG